MTTRDPSFFRPYSNDITLSIIRQAKKNDYSALIVTLDTMSIGWRPRDPKTAYLPFIHSYGCQNGFADPVFMARYGKQPQTKTPMPFSYNPKEISVRFTQGDPVAKEQIYMGTEWIGDMSLGRQIMRRAQVDQG